MIARRAARIALAILGGALGARGDTLDVSKPAPHAEGTAPTSIGTCSEKGGALRFGLAHLNDLQARYGDRIGGKSRYAYIAGYLRGLKAAQPTLVLDAGDDYEKGALAELRSNGETTRQMVQALPIDVRTIGNHDFAYGEAAVLRDVRLSKHPVLAANVRYTGSDAQPFKGFARVDVGCVKVGVIGLVTQSFGADDLPTSAPYAGVFVQDDHYQAILEREARAHRAEVDVLIALTHLGYADDVALAQRGGKLVDFIVGGHTEDLLKEPFVVNHADKTRTWVVQAGHYGEGIGHADVVVVREGRKIRVEGYEVVKVDDRMPVAPEVADLATRLEDAVADGVQKPIGRLREAVRRGKPMAELLFAAAAATWSVDALVVGHDLFWAGLPRGEVTLQRLYDTVLVQKQPAGTSGFSSIWVTEVTGAELAAIGRSFRPGAHYDWHGARERLDPARKYRLAFDKRAATYPRTVFGAEAPRVVRSVAYLGEMIDALEPHARARTAKGLTLD